MKTVSFPLFTLYLYGTAHQVNNTLCNGGSETSTRDMAYLLRVLADKGIKDLFLEFL